MNLRAKEVGSDKIIEGYFIVFNQPALLYDDVYEEIAPEAINNLGNVRALYSGNTGQVLGTVANGTLKLKKDSYGLKGTITINPKDSEAVSIYERVKSGAVTGGSFEFTNYTEEYRYEGGKNIFKIKTMELRAVSVTAFPIYPEAKIQARKKQMIEIKRNRKPLTKRKAELIKKIKSNR